MGENGRVLVTGGAGFVGSHVVDRLVGSGYKVGVIDNLSEGKLSNIEGHLKNGRVCFFEGDIRDAELVRKCVQDVGVVVHLAAITSIPFSVENPSLSLDVNVNGSAPRVGDMQVSFADISKAEKQLDYKPVVPLEKGLWSLVEEAC